MGTDETKIYYETIGEGHPLVLIHGGLLDRRIWDEQFRVFAEHYKVIRYDLRGFGKSDMPKKTFYHIDDLYNLLKFLSVDETYIVGLSLGGSIAIQLTIEHPEMVDGLVLAGSGLIGFKWSEEDRRRMTKIFMSVKDEKSALEAVKAWLKDPYMLPAMEKPDVAEKIRRICLENSNALLIDSSLGSQPEVPSIQRLSEINVPTLVVVGDRDVADIQEIANTLEANVTGARKVVVTGAGHIINMEKPKEFNRIVLDFLNTLKHYAR